MNEPFEDDRFGVAPFDRAWFLGMIRLKSSFVSPRVATGILQSETVRLIDLVHATETNVVSDRVTVARLMGMERYSCEWSILMIVDHLQRFIGDMHRLVDALVNGHAVRGVYADDLYTPDEDVGWDVVEKLDQRVRQYVDFVGDQQRLRSRLAFRHPWLGLMNAHQWHHWTAAHVRIHRRHAMKILSVAGVV